MFRLSATAEADIVDILAWTHDHFGTPARLRYERLILTALRNVAVDPDRPGSVKRPELGHGVSSYHLRHCRDQARLENGIVRRPRHLLLYRPEGAGIIGIGRVLYDAMELERHLPAEYRSE
ncbi:type II toxin-antitoxin system RelE/ParE family toxin [Rhizobium sp. 9140]|uniref:type II toxin-antitoxin system RelE/ParE family toxin n=1 Tax=Rhizobium sp. 9140 TaxID=1761900 RepID=UPI0007928448|nr:type II toxin-antitoxin system RelE/ParE family toxin [Rhizobium sp. 9140]CZT34467.1 toxin ParE1/3/4 [Rhizobium sp. 9140]